MLDAAALHGLLIKYGMARRLHILQANMGLAELKAAG
jgi:hypothetical protein